MAHAISLRLRAKSRRKTIKPPPPGWWLFMFFMAWTVYSLTNDVFNVLDPPFKFTTLLWIVAESYVLHRAWPYVKNPAKYPGFRLFFRQLPVWWGLLVWTAMPLGWMGF